MLSDSMPPWSASVMAARSRSSRESLPRPSEEWLDSAHAADSSVTSQPPLDNPYGVRLASVATFVQCTTPRPGECAPGGASSSIPSRGGEPDERNGRCGAENDEPGALPAVRLAGRHQAARGRGPDAACRPTSGAC